MCKSKDNHSLGYFNVTVNDNMFVIEGIVALLLEGLPTKISNRIESDRHRKTKDIAMRQVRSGSTTHLTLKVNNKQSRNTKESVIPFATGIHDVDLEVTRAINTLLIRRIGLKEGETQHVDAVWVRFPSLIWNGCSKSTPKSIAGSTSTQNCRLEIRRNLKLTNLE